MSGAREGVATRLRRLVSGALARDLPVFVVPDAATARARGLDLAAAGLRPAPTPRHAAILVVVGELPGGLRRAAAIAYAQMPRPRAILALGAGEIHPLPGPDWAAPAEQAAVERAVGDLRRAFAEAAFSPAVATFDADAVRTETKYTCPMHPEIVRDGPGKCPICGMDLIPREESDAHAGHARVSMDHGTATGHAAPPEARPGVEGGDAAGGYTCPMHPAVVSDAPGSCPICGMRLVPREVGDAAADGASGHAAHATTGGFTCPMHPEIVRDRPGSCPLCGMDLVPRDAPAVEPGHGTAEGQAAAAGPGGYTCPMHPEIIQDGPGSCPICGMALVPREGASQEHADMPHGAHADHGGATDGEPVPPASGGECVTHRQGAGQTIAHGMHPTAAPGGQGQHRHHHTTAHGLAADAREGGSSGHGGHPAMPVRDADRGAMDHGGDGHAPAASKGDDHPRHAGTRDIGHDDAPPTIVAGQGAMAGMDHAMPDPADTGHSMGGMDHGMGGMDHGPHDMGGMDHSMHMMGGFMSMVAMTKDLPRSRDGLPMEWVEVPVGPLFPGLPGGLALTLTLDGDVVARASLAEGTVRRMLEAAWPGPAATLPDRLARLDPLAPAAYRLLARRALEAAAGLGTDGRAARARVGMLERERAASHLGWLASFADLLGFRWLAERAAALQLAVVRVADPAALAPLREEARRLAERAARTPLLRRRLAGVGRPAAATTARRGPVARAAGATDDARATDPAYLALGFAPVVRDGDDALARLLVRLAELGQSLDLAVAAGVWGDEGTVPLGAAGGGHGMAAIETPRGVATLHLTLDGEMVREAHLDAPSAAHRGLVGPVTEGWELADALVGVASLDLSPWEMDR